MGWLRVIIRGEAGVAAGVDLVAATERIPSHVGSVLGLPSRGKNGERSFVGLTGCWICLERRREQLQKAISQSFCLLHSKADLSSFPSSRAT